MTPKKRFVMFSVLIFGVVAGLILFGTRNAKVQTEIECRLEYQAIQDNQLEKTELSKIIELVGKKSNCSNLMNSR